MKQLKKYYLFYKPFDAVCQFSPEEGLKTLSDYIKNIPKDVYPIGRLDADSEGLLLLTNDNLVNITLLHPSQKHNKTYYAQVEGIPTAEMIAMLESGVEITVNKSKYKTLPAKVEILDFEPELPERFPPIRFRKNSPTSWISITINEGKNRQVRKMTASVGLPTLRLVRYSIEKLNIEYMKSGDMMEISQEMFYKNLNLK